MKKNRNRNSLFTTHHAYNTNSNDLNDSDRFCSIFFCYIQMNCEYVFEFFFHLHSPIWFSDLNAIGRYVCMYVCECGKEKTHAVASSSLMIFIIIHHHHYHRNNVYCLDGGPMNEIHGQCSEKKG